QLASPFGKATQTDPELRVCAAHDQRERRTYLSWRTGGNFLQTSSPRGVRAAFAPASDHRQRSTPALSAQDRQSSVAIASLPEVRPASARQGKRPTRACVRLRNKIHSHCPIRRTLHPAEVDDRSAALHAQSREKFGRIC